MLAASKCLTPEMKLSLKLKLNTVKIGAVTGDTI